MTVVNTSLFSAEQIKAIQGLGIKVLQVLTPRYEYDGKTRLVESKMVQGFGDFLDFLKEPQQRGTIRGRYRITEIAVYTIGHVDSACFVRYDILNAVEEPDE